MANKNTPESSKSPKSPKRETGIFGGIDEGCIYIDHTPPKKRKHLFQIPMLIVEQIKGDFAINPFTYSHTKQIRLISN